MFVGASSSSIESGVKNMRLRISLQMPISHKPKKTSCRLSASLKELLALLLTRKINDSLNVLNIKAKKNKIGI